LNDFGLSKQLLFVNGRIHIILMVFCFLVDNIASCIKRSTLLVLSLRTNGAGHAHHMCWASTQF